MSPCRALDDYLANDLTGDDRASFIAHLPNCPDCQTAIREQERLGRLLSDATAVQEPTPVLLVARIERRLRATRSRRVAAVAAGVALLIGGASWLLSRSTSPPHEPRPVVQRDLDPPMREETTVGGPVRVSFPDRAHVLAFPPQAVSPNVTVIIVYPGLREPRTSADDTPVSLKGAIHECPAHQFLLSTHHRSAGHCGGIYSVP
jgi:anti-sigma factor RsiW